MTELYHLGVDTSAVPRVAVLVDPLLGTAPVVAAMDGRPQADLDDVRSVAMPVLRHRVMTNFAAEAADRTSEDVVQELVAGDGWWQ